MYGHRFKRFGVGWRFFGWSLLCMITFGTGYFSFTPYIQVSIAKYDDDIKG